MVVAAQYNHVGMVLMFQCPSSEFGGDIGVFIPRDVKLHD